MSTKKCFHPSLKYAEICIIVLCLQTYDFLTEFRRIYFLHNAFAKQLMSTHRILVVLPLLTAATGFIFTPRAAPAILPPQSTAFQRYSLGHRTPWQTIASTSWTLGLQLYYAIIIYKHTLVNPIMSFNPLCRNIVCACILIVISSALCRMSNKDHRMHEWMNFIAT